MPAKPKHRNAIVQAALTLFRRQGYASTGLNDIVKLSGAPKGSLYHYFPKGKLSIAEAAVLAAGRNVASTLDQLAKSNRTSPQLVRAYGKVLASWMAQSRFRSGSPIATTLLETTPDDAAITVAGRDAFANWRGAISSRLVDEGVPRARAGRLAALVVAAMEGGLIQARVEGKSDIIETSAAELGEFLGSVIAAYGGHKLPNARKRR